MEEHIDELRKFAEDFLETSKKKKTVDLDNMDIKEIFHNLQIHKIELEMQNNELKKTHDELEKSRKKYSNLYEFAPFGYITLDNKGFIQDVNLSACKMLGIKREWVIHNSIYQFISDKEHTRVTNFFNKIRKSKEADTIRIQMKHRDGNIFPVQVHCNRYVLVNTRNPYFYFAFSDISKTIQLESKIKQKSKEIVDIIENSKDCIARINDQLKITFFNTNFKECLNFGNEELLNIDISEVGFPESLIEGIEQSFDTKTLIQVEIQRDHNVIQKFFQVDLIPEMNKSGLVESVLLIAHDISQQKEKELILRKSEKFFKNVINTSIDGIWDWNLKTGHTYYNKSWWNLLGFHPDEIKPTIDSWKKLLHPEDREKVLQRMDFHINGQIEKFESTFRLRTNQNDYRWFLGKGKVIERDHRGRALRMIGINIDITIYKKLEDERIRFQKMESLGLLAGGIAHDFNNLLSIILGNVQIAKTDENCPSDIAILLENAESACKKASQITQKFITFAKGGKPVRKMLNLQEYFHDFTNYAIGPAKIDVHLNIPIITWPVFADPNQFEQIILNLVSNAKDAMPDGGVLTIWAENTEIVDDAQEIPSSKFVSLHFQDTGIGIPSENIDKIFNPYFSTKNSTGLGLAVVHSIVKNHGGRIEVNSEPGRGTEFIIHLPAASQQVIDNFDEFFEEEDMHHYKKNDKNILIMDDEKLLLEIAQKFLINAGFNVYTARNGTSALKILENCTQKQIPIHAIILDLIIRDGMGGEELIKIVNEKYPDTLRIVISGYREHPVMASHTKYGFHEKFLKPFKFKNLIHLLRDRLGLN